MLNAFPIKPSTSSFKYKKSLVLKKDHLFCRSRTHNARPIVLLPIILHLFVKPKTTSSWRLLSIIILFVFMTKFFDLSPRGNWTVVVLPRLDYSIIAKFRRANNHLSFSSSILYSGSSSCTTLYRKIIYSRPENVIWMIFRLTVMNAL